MNLIVRPFFASDVPDNPHAVDGCYDCTAMLDLYRCIGGCDSDASGDANTADRSPITEDIINMYVTDLVMLDRKHLSIVNRMHGRVHQFRGMSPATVQLEYLSMRVRKVAASDRGITPFTNKLAYYLDAHDECGALAYHYSVADIINIISADSASSDYAKYIVHCAIVYGVPAPTDYVSKSQHRLIVKTAAELAGDAPGGVRATRYAAIASAASAASTGGPAAFTGPAMFTGPAAFPAMFSAASGAFTGPAGIKIAQPFNGNAAVVRIPQMRK